MYLLSCSHATCGHASVLNRGVAGSEGCSASGMYLLGTAKLACEGQLRNFQHADHFGLTFPLATDDTFVLSGIRA
jgi:hypothetical protein